MSTRVISTCIQFIDAFSNPSKKTIDNMRKMAKEAKAAGKSIQGAGQTIAGAGSAMTKTITAPIVGVAAAAVKTAADYESAMSNVKAITGATGEDFKKLEKLGKDLGKSTAWSAQEVAQAMQYTGMAGWTAQENVEGLKGILDLASASGTDLAQTSDIMTDAISAFGYKASDSAKFADTMTKACTSANVSVETLGESYKYCGAISGTMGYKIDEVTTSLAVMGNMGIKGSQAGTALKNAIANMAAPTDKMKTAMDQLGISITNSDGSMKSWKEVIGNLQTSFKGLTQDQQAAYAKQIFGKESMAGMLAIINTSTEDYNALADAITNSGGAADQAAKTQLDNLNGQLTLLKSALEGAAITIGDKLTPYIKQAVSWVQKATDWFNSLSDAQVKSIMKWAGIIAAIGPALLIFGKVVTGVGKMVTLFGTISGAIAKAGSVMALITSPAGIVVGVLAAVALAAVLVIKNWDKIKPVIMNVKQWFVDTFGGTIKAAIAGFKETFTAAMTAIKAVLPTVQQALKNLAAAALPIIQSIGSALSRILPAAIEFVKAAIQTAVPIIQQVITTVAGVLPKAIEAAKVVIKSVTPIIQTVANVIKQIAPIIANTVVNAIQKATPVIRAMGNVVKAVIPIIGTMLKNAFQIVINIVKKVAPPIQQIAKVIGGILVAAVKAVAPVLDGMANTFSIVFTKAFNIASATVTKLQPVFNAIGTVVKAVMSVVGSVIGKTFTTIASVITSVSGSIKQIINGIMQVFKGLTDFISGVFTGNWRQAWEGVKGIFGGVFNALAGMCKVPINAVIGIINGAIRGINSISVDIPKGIPGVGGKHIGFNIPTIPALAKGTKDWVGGLAQINERGGEIVDLPKGTRVYPHDQSVSIAKNTSSAQLSAINTSLAKIEKQKANVMVTLPQIKQEPKKEARTDTLASRLAQIENKAAAKQEKAKGDITITIPKLAEQIIVKSKDDIDDIAEAIATKLKDTALNMGVV